MAAICVRYLSRHFGGVWLPVIFTFAVVKVGASPATRTADPAITLPPSVSRTVAFSKDIQPILEASCVKCHGRGREKGGLSLDSRETLLRGGDSGPAVIVGKSDKSLLISLVAGLDPDNIMPQKGTRLTTEQVGLLRAWIDQGLAWDQSVSFARPAPRNLAPLQPTGLPPGNPIDEILSSYFRTNQYNPPQVVDDRTFARRVWLDVVGLLPDAALLQEFLHDPAKDKREKLVKRLLADNQAYAIHWLGFWNDLLRNDYRGTGYIDNGRKQITSWLYSALLTNLPYDKFVAELVNPAPASEGFTRGIIWRGVVNASQSVPMQAAQNVSQVFMGVNLKCASCHDSFINDWRLSDAYGLASVYSDTPLEMYQCDKPTGRMSEPRFIYTELGGIDPAAPKPERLKRLAEIVTGPQNGRLPRTVVNRIWTRFFGHGLVEPVDDMEQPAWSPELLDVLAADLVANRYDLKKLMERILTSRSYQLPAVNIGEVPEKGFVFHGPAVRRMSAEQFRDAVGQLTDEWYAKAEFSIETSQVRASLVAADALAVALGRPNREQVATSRPSIATTLEALEMTNGETLAAVLHGGAGKLISRYPDTAKLIESIYRQGLGRSPNTTEFKLAHSLVGAPPQREGVTDLLWTIAMLPEFQLIY